MTFRQIVPLAGKEPMLSDPMNQPCGASGVKTPVDFVSGLQSLCRTSQLLAHLPCIRALAPAGVRKATLDSDPETQLMLVVVLLFPKSTQSRICFTALWSKLPSRGKAIGCPFDALLPRYTFSYQSL